MYLKVKGFVKLVVVDWLSKIKVEKSYKAQKVNEKTKNSIHVRSRS